MSGRQLPPQLQMASDNFGACLSKNGDDYSDCLGTQSTPFCLDKKNLANLDCRVTFWMESANSNTITEFDACAIQAQRESIICRRADLEEVCSSNFERAATKCSENAGRLKRVKP